MLENVTFKHRAHLPGWAENAWAAPPLYQSVDWSSSLWTLGHYTGFAEEHRDRPGHLLPSSLDL